MGSIPYSDKPIVYTDKATGVRYFLRPPCGEVEYEMFDLVDSLPSDRKKRIEFFQKNKKELRKFDDNILDIILFGWESDKVNIPEFPKSGKPSKLMKSELKTSILNFYNSQKDFTEDELKK